MYELKPLDQETMQYVRRHALHYEIRLTKLRAWGAYLDSLILTVLAAMLIPCFALTVAIIYLGIAGQLSYGVVYSFLASAVATPLIVITPFRIGTFLDLRGGIGLLAKTVLPLTLGIGTGIVVLSFLPILPSMGLASSSIRLAVSVGLLVGSYMMSITSAASLLIVLLGIGLQRLNSSLHPEAMLVYSVVNTLLLTASSNRWTRIERKRLIMASLEQSARAVESDLPKQLESGDQLTDDWLRDRVKQIVAMLREYKKWVLTPKLDTRNRLQERLVDVYIAAARGDWDTLDRATTELPKSNQQLTVAKNFFGVIRLVVSAFAPLVILWGFQQTWLALSGPALQYAIVGGIVWTSLSILIWINPEIKEILGAAESFKKLIL